MIGWLAAWWAVWDAVRRARASRRQRRAWEAFCAKYPAAAEARYVLAETVRSMLWEEAIGDLVITRMVDESDEELAERRELYWADALRGVVADMGHELVGCSLDGDSVKLDVHVRRQATEVYTMARVR